ncbi:glycosyltransferase family 2 protein [Echinicola sp. 20G]|uniref:glycosyltransferase family 2 protein n=1 Tax=Echinicola sp. 20G TaxID=2781961 RepID=UPI0019100501|nr:glycosyltransferase family 2 protein [Echinicola sp. 20G]
MNVSIITVTFNSEETLQGTIDSVQSQDYPNIEYIVIDGKSKDRTVDIIKDNQAVISKWISESDKGLYDAMNKGIQMATGDVVGIINSDDFYHRKDAISSIVKGLKESNAECVFGDVDFVRPKNLNKVIRHYSSKRFAPWKFRLGYMPAHPTFYTYKRNFEKFGYYKTDYRIAADFELLIRFLFKEKLSFKYIPETILRMRTGGTSTASVKSTLIINKENKRALKENGIYGNYLMLTSRYFTKILEFIR